MTWAITAGRKSFWRLWNWLPRKGWEAKNPKEPDVRQMNEYLEWFCKENAIKRRK